MLLLNADAVRTALPMSDAITLMTDVMSDFSDGLVTQPVRTIVRPESGAGVLATMPCHLGGSAGFGLKAIMLKPDNPAKGLPSHTGVVFVFDPDTGRPLALLDGAAVTAIRTAAVSAVATAALAVAEAGDLAILGAGVQARSHLEAMNEVRELRRVRLWNRGAERALDFQRFAKSIVDVPVEVVGSPAEALDGADLVCTTLGTKEPLVHAEYLAPGAHLNAIGASVADARELTSAAVARCAVFVDSRQSAAVESADLGVPLAEGLITADHVLAELGTVLLGRHPGRKNQFEITLYKSLGLAAQDVAAGFAIADRAWELGLGTTVEF